MENKIRMENWFKRDIFSKPIKYSKEHADCNGVSEVVDEMHATFDKYEKEFFEFVERNTPALDDTYASYAKATKNKNLFKIIFLVCIVIEAAALIIKYCVNSRMIDFWFPCALCGLILVCICLSVSSRKHDYTFLVYRLEKDAKKIIDKYTGYADEFYKMIDELYLRSLDPVMREMLLCHRQDQAEKRELRDELRRQAERYEAVIKDIKSSHVAALNDVKKSQEEGNEALKEMLKIEQDREWRSGRY